MTTIKEYKAMIEGATDAPLQYFIPTHSSKSEVNEDGNNYWEIQPIKFQGGVQYLNIAGWMMEQTAALLVLSYNIATELIRVIELAEEALKALPNEKGQSIAFEGSPYYLVDPDTIQACEQALSEIRKLTI